MKVAGEAAELDRRGRLGPLESGLGRGEAVNLHLELVGAGLLALADVGELLRQGVGLLVVTLVCCLQRPLQRRHLLFPLAELSDCGATDRVLVGMLCLYFSGDGAGIALPPEPVSHTHRRPRLREQSCARTNAMRRGISRTCSIA